MYKYILYVSFVNWVSVEINLKNVSIIILIFKGFLMRVFLIIVNTVTLLLTILLPAIADSAVHH